MAAHRLASRRDLRTQCDALRDRIADLEAERNRLLAENADLTCTVVRTTRELDEAAIDLSGAMEDRRTATARADALAEQHAAAVAETHRLRAEAAERDAVTVPPMVRDTSHPADVSTAPVDVRDVRDPRPTVPIRVVPLHQRTA